MDFLTQIEENKKKFIAFNDSKFKRFQELVSNPTLKRVINSIPFLLNVNQSKLPGYVEGKTPYGIINYKADEDTKRFIRSKYPAVKVDIDIEKPFIEMLAVMGSVGTIAYNKKSDFDYWVCINKQNVSQEALECFSKKVIAIQEWAIVESATPIHLFINDVENIKQNIFAEDTEEVFGSTNGAVLKDEFYRSSIIICGKIPFWWVIPQFVRDNEYDNLYQRLPEEKRDTEYADLGNLYKISKEDFLGAALFQIIKSLGNPFKSIIKIGVLEKYLFGSDDSPLLSQKVKINIQRVNLDNAILDSYLLMFQEVYDYYNTTMDDNALLNILKQNLYLKIDPQLSKYMGLKRRKNVPYKVGVMFQYVKEWGWDIDNIKDLDNFDNWDFNKIINFWDSVKKFMLLSYQRISVQLPTLNLAKKISETDFMLLSRKIKTHFAREKDKIEQFITFKDTPFESILYLEPISQDIHDVEWRLYKRNTSEEDSFVSTTIKSDSSILKLLVWSILNKIYDKVFSRLNIQSGYSRMDQKRIMELLNQLSEFFSGGRIYIKNEYFLQSAFNILNFIIINFNKEDKDRIETMHYLYHTSWGESYLKEYSSETNLSKILYMILRDGHKLRRNFDNYCAINTPEPYKKHNKRIISLFKDAYSFIVENDRGNAARFVFCVKDQYIVITRDAGKIEQDAYPNIISLLLSINLKPKKDINYLFFGEDGPLKTLNMIYDKSQRDSIFITYEERGDFIFAYVINERGNIFAFFYPKKTREYLLIYLYGFCLSIMKRIKKMDLFSNIKKNTINVFCIKTDRFGKVSIKDETNVIEGQYLLKSQTKSTLTASVSKHRGKETYYNLIYPHNASSGFIASSKIAVLSETLTELKNNGIAANIIRDLVFSDLKDKETGIGSTLYFLEKCKLEFLIEKSIKKN